MLKQDSLESGNRTYSFHLQITDSTSRKAHQHVKENAEQTLGEKEKQIRKVSTSLTFVTNGKKYCRHHVCSKSH